MFAIGAERGTCHRSNFSVISTSCLENKKTHMVYFQFRDQVLPRPQGPLSREDPGNESSKLRQICEPAGVKQAISSRPRFFEFFFFFFELGGCLVPRHLSLGPRFHLMTGRAQGMNLPLANFSHHPFKLRTFGCSLPFKTNVPSPLSE